MIASQPSEVLNRFNCTAYCSFQVSSIFWQGSICMSESQPADLALMRELNERIVLGLLRQEGPISRAELARRSNLSRSTVSSIIATLLALDVVHETGIGDSHGGRRPI